MTDDFGEQMRNAAHAAAARSVQPPVDVVRRRLARRRASTGLGVAVVVALAVAASAGMWETRSGLRPVTPSPSASPQPTYTAEQSPAPSPTASLAASPAPAPMTIVATRGDETEKRPIVFLSATTGRVMRSLAAQQGDGPMSAPVVSYDRKTIYYSRIVTSCLNEIVAVPTRGGPETVLANGFDPAVSPDDRWLAYRTQADACADQTILVVKDLRSGTERRWAARDEADGDVVAMAWAPDSRRLAVIRQFPRRPADVKAESGAAGYIDRDLWILDTRAPGTTVDAGNQVPGVKGLIARATYRGPEGALLVLGVPSHGDMPSVLSEVDPETGRSREVVAFPHPVYEFDFDASGQHLLYIWEGTLYRWVAGRSAKIADRINGADW